MPLGCPGDRKDEGEGAHDHEHRVGGRHADGKERGAGDDAENGAESGITAVDEKQHGGVLSDRLVEIVRAAIVMALHPASTIS